MELTIFNYKSILKNNHLEKNQSGCIREMNECNRFLTEMEILHNHCQTEDMIRKILLDKCLCLFLNFDNLYKTVYITKNIMEVCKCIKYVQKHIYQLKEHMEFNNYVY